MGTGGEAMNDWKAEKQFSDQYLNQIKQILGLHLISEPPTEEDQKRCTDLITMKMEPVRVLCRIRREKYLDKYGDEFTIRAECANGATTELTKIIEGWGDYMFYGFGNDNGQIVKWMLADVKVFRLAYMRSLYAKKPLGTKQTNKDMTDTKFIAFKINEFPDNFILAHGGA